MDVVHIATGIATAAQGNARYNAGEKHGAMIFVRAISQEEAIKKIDAAMFEAFWMLSVEKMGTLPDAEAKPGATDPLEIALNTALEDGCGVVIYSDIEE